MNKAKNTENIELVLDSTVERISGEAKVSSIEVKNKITGNTDEFAVDGVFLAVGMQPVTAFVDKVKTVPQMFPECMLRAIS